MSDKQYKLSGGINWFDCEVIAEFGDEVWLHNKTTGSTPKCNKRDICFRDKPKQIRDHPYCG
jgi:hypothetical protein